MFVGVVNGYECVSVHVCGRMCVCHVSVCDLGDGSEVDGLIMCECVTLGIVAT